MSHASTLPRASSPGPLPRPYLTPACRVGADRWPDTAAPPEPTIGVRWETPSGETFRILITDAQLHGRACILCGSERTDLLRDAGHAYTAEGGWRVKACPDGECEVQA